MSGLESMSHGEDLARKLQAEAPPAIPLSDPRVQVFLAKLAYPNDPQPLNKWLAGDEVTGTPPLSSPFRAYIEELRSDGGVMEIDINDSAALTQLLEKVKSHPPETLH